MPQRNIKQLDFDNPLDIKAYQYDIVGGIELSSGAIRNHIPELMYKLFSIAGYNKKDVDEKFSGMINALSYGAPPHGGIAPGIDRIVMMLAEKENIREITLNESKCSRSNDASSLRGKRKSVKRVKH